MTDLFLKIVNMSITASWLVLAVVILRLFLRKAPKWISVLLWAVVAVRLLCPISIESAVSLIPDPEPVSPQIMEDPVPTDQTYEQFTGAQINIPVDPNRVQTVVPDSQTQEAPAVRLFPILSYVWLGGMALLLAYTVFTYLRLRLRLREAVKYCDGVYMSENAFSPFVLGFVKPAIYLPYGMDETDMSHVIAHEQAHIHRKDHWWKPVGFLLLSIHWFNPVMWLAYVLLCRDIELACDEKVVMKLTPEQRADYSQALLRCSINRRMIAACPIAFGESSVGMRIKAVLHYKKPAFWIVVVSLITCAVVACCFLTDPKKEEEPIQPQKYPGYYEQLTQLMGQPKAQVAKALGLEEYQLTERAANLSFYDTPLEVNYGGITFRIQLGFNLYEDKLHSFSYCAAYENDPESVAKDTLAVVKHIESTLGKPHPYGPERIAEMPEDKLHASVSKEEGVLFQNYWDLSDQVSKTQKSYMDYLRTADYWREYRYKPCYFMTLSVSADSNLETGYITLAYSIRQSTWTTSNSNSFSVENLGEISDKEVEPDFMISLLIGVPDSSEYRRAVIDAVRILPDRSYDLIYYAGDAAGIASHVVGILTARNDIPHVFVDIPIPMQRCQYLGTRGDILDISQYLEDRDGVSKPMWDYISVLPESQQQALLDQLRDETTGEIYAFPVIEITDGTAVLRENVSVVTRVCGTPKTAIQYLMQVYYGTDS